MLQPCLSHTVRFYISGHGFNCLFCAFAYTQSAMHENKIIIVDGDTEIISRTSFHSYDFCVVNAVAVYRLPWHTCTMICSAVINGPEKVWVYLYSIH